MENPWKSLKGADYTIQNLGRPAIFLLPSCKLKRRSRNALGHVTVEELLHLFLLDNFGSFTTTLIPQFGVWRNGGDRIVYDECREYEVSFVGKERIPLLLAELAKVAREIEEECIYFKAGECSCLIYPA